MRGLPFKQNKVARVCMAAPGSWLIERDILDEQRATVAATVAAAPSATDNSVSAPLPGATVISVVFCLSEPLATRKPGKFPNIALSVITRWSAVAATVGLPAIWISPSS